MKILTVLLVLLLTSCSARSNQQTNIPQEDNVQKSVAVETAIPTQEPIEQKQKAPEIISQKSTKVLDKESNRLSNIKLAVKAINGTVVKKGDIFSFNKVVGERTEEKGYKIATVLKGEEHIEGIGGGICQVSTTIFQAVEKAGLEIIERHNHKIEVGYAPNGTDSTVNYNTLDMKFKNNLGYDIKLEAKVQKNKVIVIIYKE